MSIETNIFATYFDTHIFLLKITAFWVYDEKTSITKQYLQFFYNIFWALYVYILYLPAEILYVFYSFNDMNKFLRSLRDIGNHIALIHKAFNYFAKRAELLQLLNTLCDGKYRYEDFEDFHPKLIVKEEKRGALRWTLFFWCLVNAICFSMFSSCLYTFIFAPQFSMKDGVSVYSQKQPVNTVSPFGSGTRSKYLITFFYTIIALTFYAWMIAALDTLFITIMSCITAHLKILDGAFKTIRQRCCRRLHYHSNYTTFYDPQDLQEEVRREMEKCVKHLQTVYQVADQLESIYNGQTLLQTFISLGEMCFSLYLLSETFDENIGTEVTYLIATGFELLMYCWFGNRLTEASSEVSYALYDSDWFSTNLSYRKELILTMARMNRPIYITIGKITPLTFNTFLTMARGAYSFFTFLKQRQGINAK